MRKTYKRRVLALIVMLLLFVGLHAFEEVRKGEKDAYYAADTHWSWKEVRKTAENMRF
jgi:hypothetical protein